MEDISRELEREIARAKPAPYKSSTTKKILIIDDFGECRSGGYLKTLAYLFFIISLAGILGTAGFYYLFSDVRKENLTLKERLALTEKKTDRLRNDKEILMARLVMAGEKPELAAPKVDSREMAGPQPDQPPAKEKQSGIMTKSKPERDDASQVVNEEVAPVENASAADEDAGQQKASPDEPKGVPAVTESDVSVEKFSVVRGKNNAELTVRFNIRNISDEPKEISGRIFAVMKPENGGKKDWVVVPGGTMTDGLPGPYPRGQYFSISRFKPVRFTIKSLAAPESFKTATVYIFGDDQQLMYTDTIQINGDDG